jgi:tRNA(fMet)-specific endonuclease VapC
MLNNSNNPVLIDTDVLSYLYNEHSLAENYLKILEGHHGLVALQTFCEMRYGAFLNGWGKRRLDRLENFLDDYTMIEPNNETGILWAKLRVQVRQIGRHIARSDAWIAATALEYKVALVTHNVKDFDAVEGLQILSLNLKKSTHDSRVT